MSSISRDARARRALKRNYKALEKEVESLKNEVGSLKKKLKVAQQPKQTAERSEKKGSSACIKYIKMKPGHYPFVKYKELLGEGHIYNIGRSDSLGRHPEEIGLRIGNPVVSRFHASIKLAEEGWQIENKDSKNGVFVNGRRVEGHRILKDDDVISLGRSDKYSKHSKRKGAIILFTLSKQ